MTNMILAIAGFHGAGKSTIAKYIAKKYSLRYISSGELFRKIAEERGVSLSKLSRIAEEDPSIDYEIDNRIREEAKKGSMVGDALLSGWMLKDVADIKIWLKAPLEVRVKRIADREGRDYNEVYNETLEREDSERRRFRKYYGVDLDDLSIYDYILSTHLIDLNTLIKIIDEIISNYMVRREG